MAATVIAVLVSCTGEPTSTPGPTSDPDPTRPAAAVPTAPSSTPASPPSAPGSSILARGEGSPYPDLAPGWVQLRMEGLVLGPGQGLEVAFAGGQVVEVSGPSGLVVCAGADRCHDLGGPAVILDAPGTGASSSLSLRATAEVSGPSPVSLSYRPGGAETTLTFDRLGPDEVFLTRLPAGAGDFSARASWPGRGESARMTLLTSEPGAVTVDGADESGLVSGGPPLDLTHSATPATQPILTVAGRAGAVSDFRLAVTWP